ncbi:MAG: glycosyltransferase [Candidatus Aenigmarchaeota archaeon]|nr:glycosyltransferase [Candidatus Aenigmarchaeota archaeon]
MIDASIIIVNWNTKDYLLQCLESLILETNRCNIEIIVVDNGSTDGSPETVKERFRNVRLIQNRDNLGFAKANNIGIRQSSGRYICLLNSDMKVLEGCIDRMVTYMDQNRSIGVLAPKILNPDMTTRFDCREFPTIWNTFCRALGLHKIFPRNRFFSDYIMWYFPHNSIRSIDYVAGCFLMVRKSAIDEVDLLDENFFMYAEDKDWCKRLREAGWDVVFYPYAEAIHHAGASSARSPNKLLIERLRSNLYYWEKHHSKLAQITFFGLLLFHHTLRVVGSAIAYSIRPSQRVKYAATLTGHIACLRWLTNNILFRIRQKVKIPGFSFEKTDN